MAEQPGRQEQDRPQKREHRPQCDAQQPERQRHEPHHRPRDQRQETAGQQHASRLSQTWLRENGKWQLIQARIISEVRLKQFAR